MIERILARLRRLPRDENAQVMPAGAIMMIVLLLFAVGLYDTGVLLAERMQLQNIADACAYSGACWEARALNFAAYTNRAMTAHLVTVSQLTFLRCNSLFLNQVWNRYRALVAMIPNVGLIAEKWVGKGMDAYRIGAERAFYAGVPACEAMNKAIRVAQLAYVEATTGIVPVAMASCAGANDPDVRLIASGRGAFAAIETARQYQMAIDPTVEPTAARNVSANSAGWYFQNRHKYFLIVPPSVYKRNAYAPSRDMCVVERWQEWGFNRRKRRFQYMTVIKTSAYASQAGFRGYPQTVGLRDKAKPPSVFAICRKKAEAMPLMPIPGLNLAGEMRGGAMTTVARAEATYYRPDKPFEPANLWNPFWSARLAPLDDTPSLILMNVASPGTGMPGLTTGLH